METLYSRDSKGNIVEWKGYVEGQEFSSDYAKIIILEGLFTGVKTKYEKLLKKGKNIGKINETTPYAQAVSELQSKYEKKRKAGYKSLKDLNIEEIC